MTWASGDCTVTYNPNTYSLSVTGNGDMDDYSDDAPWSSYYDYIYELNIARGVTSIGSWAFSGSSLTNIVIPDTVTTIGQFAFYRNNSYEPICVTIPSSVTIIGE